MIKYSSLALLTFLIFSCGENTPVEDSVTETTQVDSTQAEVEPEVKYPLPVEFASSDGLIISGEIYKIDETSPAILLCHQAGYNLHEYDEIAPKLNELGFNCIAIDQRSGGVLNEFTNQTADRANAKNLPVQYIDAEQDIEAAINFTYGYFKQPVILWGSSYSSALALHIGAKNENVKAVVSFSPGDYFGDAKPLLKTTMMDMNLPYFITSSKDEAASITDFLSGKRPTENQSHFIPEASGVHGSRALWENNPSQQEYWTAIEAFLLNL
ncbi:MAG: pimeloyl-ACP methyl ester carboxylesterase [Crocinitomix sp.]|jgi:pimeloyl-ACP methyl ester carboxylesterase